MFLEIIFLIFFGSIIILLRILDLKGSTNIVYQLCENIETICNNSFVKNHYCCLIIAINQSCSNVSRLKYQLNLKSQLLQNTQLIHVYILQFNELLIAVNTVWLPDIVAGLLI